MKIVLVLREACVVSLKQKKKQQNLFRFCFFLVFAPRRVLFTPGGRGALTHGDGELERSNN